MLKLVKYELRKNRTALLVLLAIAAALEAYFLISIAREASEDVYTAIALLTLLFACVSFAVFILGVSSYSGELKRKSSYLIFMTPNSALAVVISKLLFTLVLAVLFSALALALLAVDIPIFLDVYGEWEGYYMLFEQLLLQQGVALGEIISGFLLTVAQLFLQILSYVGVAYLSITLSATILQSRKGRGLVSFLLFVGHRLRALPHFRPLCEGNIRDVRDRVLCAGAGANAPAKRARADCLHHPQRLAAEKTRQSVRLRQQPASGMGAGCFSVRSAHGRAQGFEDAGGKGVVLQGFLRVPLHAHEEAFPRHLHGLDLAVGRAGGDDQAVGHAVEHLMVVAVDARDGAPASAARREPGSRRTSCQTGSSEVSETRWPDMSCLSVPPRATLISCMPRQMPRTGMLRPNTRSKSASSV